MPHKSHQYGVDIITRLQQEADNDGSSLIWTGFITNVIREIAGHGQETNMKRRLLEYGAIRGTSDKLGWEVADYDPSTWDYDSHRIPVATRPLTKIELRDDILDRLTQNMNEIRTSLNVLVGQNTVILELLKTEPETETDTAMDLFAAALSSQNGLTFEERLNEQSNSDTEVT